MREDDVRRVLEEVAEEMRVAAIDDHPDLILGDVSPEAAEAIFEDLEEMGMIAGRARIEQRAEELAQQRLLALKQEYGV
jgi:hypothetical protein